MRIDAEDFPSGKRPEVAQAPDRVQGPDLVERPDAVQEIQRVQTIELLVREAEARITEIDGRLAASRADEVAEQRRVRDVNRALVQNGFELRRLYEDGYAEGFRPELRAEVQALAQERLDLDEEWRGGKLEREALQRERALWRRVSNSDVVQERYADRGRLSPSGPTLASLHDGGQGQGLVPRPESHDARTMKLLGMTSVAELRKHGRELLTKE
jgi:hypothetical protein